MRFKWVPEPPATIGQLTAIHRAIPLVPATESTCLQRLVDRETAIDSREAANQWLTFLRAIDAIERTPRGYRRQHTELTAAELHTRVLDRIYGARELHEVLAAADQPMDIETIVDRGADLPTWEQYHHTDHQQVHRRRQRRLAEWFVLCEVAEKTAPGYRLLDAS